METKPTVMTELVLQKLREAFLFGCSDREACLYADIAPSTLYNYQNANPGYLEQKETWKESPSVLARKTVYTEMASDGKLAFDYLKNKKSDEFNTKTKDESKTDNTHTVKWQI